MGAGYELARTCRRELSRSIRQPTAKSAERNPTAAMAIFDPARREHRELPSAVTAVPPVWILQVESLWDQFEERVGIMAT